MIGKESFKLLIRRKEFADKDIIESKGILTKLKFWKRG